MDKTSASPVGGDVADGKTRLLEATEEGIAETAAILRSGGLAAFATETVYGLGADATAPAAIAKIYAAKGRPSFNPLIAHVPDFLAASREGRFNAEARALAQAFWPGPLTLVTPLADGASVCELARAGLETIALRAPDHAMAQRLLTALGRPIAAPSANRSGHVSPVTARHVLDDLEGRIDAVLDGGAARVGLESTIVACLDGAPVLLRPGAISRKMLEEIVGTVANPQSAKITAPGMMASHYAPRAKMRLNAQSLEAEEACLDFGNNFSGAKNTRLDLSPSGDLVEAAANLYAYLRRLDATGAEKIAVAPIPDGGIGAAIIDRLQRAAAPRSKSNSYSGGSA